MEGSTIFSVVDLKLGENSTQTYMDDIIVFSTSYREQEKHLKELLESVRRFRLKISPEKSRLAQTEVKFMGHLVSAEGIRPNFDRVSAIKEMPISRTVKDVRISLGMIGSYRRLISQFADIAEPF